MRFPSEPRYPRTKKYANDFLLNYGFDKLPIDPFKIIKDKKWALMTYGELMAQNNCSRKAIKENISEDGFTSFNGRNYSIAYDELIRSGGRIRFTLFHEIGHIYLNHFIDFKETTIRRGSLKEDEYDILEKEAHYFAKNVAAPLIVLDALQIKNFSQIIRITGLSKPASKNRYNDLAAWKARKYKSIPEISISVNFYNFIYKKTCNICGYFFISHEVQYCPICGSNEFEWEEGNMIYDDGYELDENGRAIICPRCGNEQIDAEGRYCRICSANLTNRCTQDEDIWGGYNDNDLVAKACGKLAAGNARYCEFCGSPTTFYKDELLKPWDKVKDKILTRQRTTSSKEPVDDGFFPPEDEEELPF